MSAYALGLLTALVVKASHNICDKGLGLLLINSLQGVPHVLNTGHVLDAIKGSV
jgi:hypothetical protein